MARRRRASRGPSRSKPAWNEPVRAPRPILAHVFGGFAVIMFGIVFGIVSRYVVLVGLLGGFAIGFLAALNVMVLFKMNRKAAWLLAPLSLLYAALGFLILVLTPLAWVTLEKDPKAGAETAVRLAWAFYKTSLPMLSSSLLTTLCAVAGAAISLVAMGSRLFPKKPVSGSQAS
jgi:hypothetical protein